MLNPKVWEDIRSARKEFKAGKSVSWRSMLNTLQNKVSISLPGALVKKLEKEAKKEGISRNEIIKRSLFCYFFVNDLSKARKRAISELDRKGVILTKKEVLNRLKNKPLKSSFRFLYKNIHS